MKQQHKPADATSIRARPKHPEGKVHSNGALAPSKPALAGHGRDTIIRESAYAFYEARGRADGHSMEDWLKAEAELDRALAGSGTGG